MWRYGLLLATVFGLATFSGCGGDSKPEPLTAEQERELERQMEEVQQQEAAALSQEPAGEGTDGR